MSPRQTRRSRRWLRVLAWLAGVTLLIALSVPVAIGVLLTRFAGTRPQDRVLRTTPADHGRSYRTVLLRTRDGVPISSWLLRAGSPAECSVVMAHGLFRSRRELLERGAWLARRRCRALAVDLRRHGESGGERTTLGFSEALDVVAGAEFLRREFPEDRLFLYGVSMGGAAVAGAGVRLSEPPTGVVLDSAFRSAPQVVDRYADLFFGLPPFPARDLTLIGMGLSARFWPWDLDVEALSARLGESGVPVLVIAGESDRRAPAADQLAVFRANGHPASRILRVGEAGHGRPCLVDGAACEAAISDFLGLDPEPDRGAREVPLPYDPGP